MSENATTEVPVGDNDGDLVGYDAGEDKWVHKNRAAVMAWLQLGEVASLDESDILVSANNLSEVDPVVASSNLKVLRGRQFQPFCYYTHMGTSVDSFVAPAQGTEYAMRFEVGESRTFDRAGLEVTTGAASNVVRIGVRADDDCYPGTLLHDLGTLDASATGYQEMTVSVPLTPGRYWLTATLQGGTGAQVRHRTIDPMVAITVTTTNNTVAYYQTGVTGALPSTWPGTVQSTQIGPKILLRASGS